MSSCFVPSSVCVGAALALVSASALAQEKGAPATPEHALPWKGHAIYAGAGAGIVPGIGEHTMNARVLGVLALTDWAMVEGGLSAMRFTAEDHHGERSESTGLGFGFGFRVAPFADSRTHPERPSALPFRPYAALRVTHIHLSPDLWGPHEHSGETGVHDHVSVHRFGAAAAVGADAPIAGPLRMGIDVEALALSGPGVNVFFQSVLTLGVAL